jgi:hypothetical protein
MHSVFSYAHLFLKVLWLPKTCFKFQLLTQKNQLGHFHLFVFLYPQIHRKCNMHAQNFFGGKKCAHSGMSLMFTLKLMQSISHRISRFPFSLRQRGIFDLILCLFINHQHTILKKNKVQYILWAKNCWHYLLKVW